MFEKPGPGAVLVDVRPFQGELSLTAPPSCPFHLRALSSRLDQASSFLPLWILAKPLHATSLLGWGRGVPKPGVFPRNGCLLPLQCLP